MPRCTLTLAAVTDMSARAAASSMDKPRSLTSLIIERWRGGSRAKLSHISSYRTLFRVLQGKEFTGVLDRDSGATAGAAENSR